MISFRLLFLCSETHTFSNYLASPQIFIGGHLEQHRLERVVVDFALRGQYGFLRIGRRDLADEALKALWVISNLLT